MIALTDTQIEKIESQLQAQGVTYQPLYEELLDHVCCLVEEKMWDEQLSFDKAFELALEAFDDFNFEQIQEQTLTIYISKSISMKKVMMMAAMLLVILVFGASSLKESVLLEPPSIKPLKGNHVVTSGFGLRMHPTKKVKKHHLGVDFKTKTGTPILATSDGIIEKVLSSKGGYGKHIIIKHDDEYQTLYAHLSAFKVKKGDAVKKGDVIGLTGNTGKSAKPHLHYEVRKNGKAVNPEEYFK